MTPKSVAILSFKLAKSHGEGSRGGHVIGHTKSGKPIYGDTVHHTEVDEIFTGGGNTQFKTHWHQSGDGVHWATVHVGDTAHFSTGKYDSMGGAASEVKTYLAGVREAGRKRHFGDKFAPDPKHAQRVQNALSFHTELLKRKKSELRSAKKYGSPDPGVVEGLQQEVDHHVNQVSILSDQLKGL